MTDERHGTGPYHPVVQQIVRDMIFSSSGPAPATSTSPAPATSTAPGQSTAAPVTTAGPSLPNPGGPAETQTLALSYSWPQEPSGIQRSTALMSTNILELPRLPYQQLQLGRKYLSYSIFMVNNYVYNIR